MKIHIVQKGDTLWNLAQKYGVDFQELLEANSHLANPDLIMPGMKIKIPTSAVPAKKDTGKGKVVAPKQAVKKEIKEVKKELPKMELAPTQVAEEDVSKLKDLIKKAAPHVVKKLLVEHKPEVVQQIKIEIINQQETAVKMAQPAPLPKMEPYIPPKPMPMPMPQAAAPQTGPDCPPAKPMPQMMAPQAMPGCQPVKPMQLGPTMHQCPTCSSKQGMSKAGFMLPQSKAWGMGTPGQGTAMMPYSGPGYGMMTSPGAYAPMGGYPGVFSTGMGGYAPYMQPGMGMMEPLGNYGYYGQNIPTHSYQREIEEQSGEEQQN